MDGAGPHARAIRQITEGLVADVDGAMDLELEPVIEVIEPAPPPKPAAPPKPAPARVLPSAPRSARRRTVTLPGMTPYPPARPQH